MRTYNPKIESLAREFKDLAVQMLGETALTQESLADSLSTTQGTISRWLAYTSDLHIPAIALAILPKEFSLPLLKWILDRHGLIATPKIPVTGELNGDLTDEGLDLAELTGKMIEHFRRTSGNRRQLAKDIDRMEQVIARAKAEVEHMP